MLSKMIIQNKWFDMSIVIIPCAIVPVKYSICGMDQTMMIGTQDYKIACIIVKRFRKWDNMMCFGNIQPIYVFETHSAYLTSVTI